MVKGLVDRTDDRTTVINIRAPISQKNLVDQAAQAVGKTRTEFILDAARRAAEEVIRDRTVYVINSSDFDKLISVLDQPVGDNEKLRKLLRRKPLWE